MKLRISRLFALLAVSVGLLTFLAADVRAGAPAKVPSMKIEGTITQYADKSKITIRSGGKDWELMLDGKHTMLVGKPAVDKMATVWYKKKKGNLWATKIEMKK